MEYSTAVWLSASGLLKTMEDGIKSPIHVEASGNTKRGAKVDAVDLCYSIVVNGKMQRILKNVSFGLDSGDMCALMGPSGAGKRYFAVQSN